MYTSVNYTLATISLYVLFGQLLYKIEKVCNVIPFGEEGSKIRGDSKSVLLCMWFCFTFLA